ncbi:hypothetical protein PVAP13_7KG053109 [Panicum virgatum]|uniref:Uncharacterized protein n=1 Tax=Panicum virgatum TaxID=38727 RepID=A0A8T0Q9H5_PANVG|nr:hypothetical protein PVAP13_7KG053109 [Panicum virgatum]
MLDETSEHLFLLCSSAVTRWFCICITLDDDLSLNENIIAAKRIFPYPFFMEVFMIGAWCIWNERNALIFYGKTPSMAAWKVSFKREVLDYLHKIKPAWHQAIHSWLDTL